MHQRRAMLLRSLVGFAVLGCLAACSAESDEDGSGCRGVAGCPASSDSIGFANGGGEVDGQPALLLVHRPKGTLPNGPERTTFVVSWDGNAVAVAPRSERFKDAGVTVEPASDQTTRFTWPSGVRGEASLVAEGVRITFRRGASALTVTCRATPTAVDCG